MFLLVLLLISSPWDEYYVARGLYNQGRFDEARSRFELLLQDYPYSDITPYCIFYIANLTKDPDEALGHYRRVIELYPQSKVADNSLARLASYHFAMTEYQAADSIYKNIIDKYPDGDCIEGARRWREKIGSFRISKQFAIQIGAFSSRSNAERCISEYKNFITRILFDGKFYKAIIGEFNSEEDAKRFKEEMELDGFIVEIPQG